MDGTEFGRAVTRCLGWLRDQFAALLPPRPVYTASHPLGCHRQRIPDRLVFEKLLQVLRFCCSYEAVADSSCSATTIRGRRDEWIEAGIFAGLKQIALDAYDRIRCLMRAPRSLIPGSAAARRTRPPLHRQNNGPARRRQASAGLPLRSSTH
jgi:transposase